MKNICGTVLKVVASVLAVFGVVSAIWYWQEHRQKYVVVYTTEPDDFNMLY